jgi:hypothetical protein
MPLKGNETPASDGSCRSQGPLTPPAYHMAGMATVQLKEWADPEMARARVAYHLPFYREAPGSQGHWAGAPRRPGLGRAGDCPGSIVDGPIRIGHRRWSSPAGPPSLRAVPDDRPALDQDRPSPDLPASTRAIPTPTLPRLPPRTERGGSMQTRMSLRRFVASRCLGSRRPSPRWDRELGRRRGALGRSHRIARLGRDRAGRGPADRPAGDGPADRDGDRRRRLDPRPHPKPVLVEPRPRRGRGRRPGPGRPPGRRSATIVARGGSVDVSTVVRVEGQESPAPVSFRAT